MSHPAPVADWVTIPDLYRDPFPIYERLRAEGGVHWVPQVGRYLITSYAAVHETEMDQDLFSANEEGSLQIRAMGHSMLRRDDPDHYVERKAWQPVLRPGVVQRVWIEVFEQNAQHYLDELVAKGPGADLVWDFAAPYAAENLREILGLHNVSQEDLQRWSQTMIDATGNYADDPEVWAKGQRSFDEVDVALDEMLRWHADHPDHSLISSLLRIPDYEMPIEKVRANIKMTIGGGVNEPRDALGVGAWALLNRPAQLAAVEADPTLWPTVFDESIRWIAPIGMYSRQVTRDTELSGALLPKGARLGICVLSANRDESVWTDAGAFDIRRELKPHLAFSKGVHVCLGAWVAKAEVATVGLPRLFERLRGLELVPENPALVGGWVFRGMTQLPVRWSGSVSGQSDTRAGVRDGTNEVSRRIAIVGSGPAGCFMADALRRILPASELDVLEALPTPYGLVRSGVAADHRGTKSVARQFERLFLEQGVRFQGNTRLGSDVSLTELKEAYDAVVLATGMHTDATLSVPGFALSGIHGAGQITRMLNAHPDEEGLVELGERVVVIGHGNVAMDVVRLMVRDADEFDGTDLDDAVRDEMVGSVRVVHVVGRSGPAQAKFDPVMVRELAGLQGVTHIVHGVEWDPVATSKDARLDAVRSLTEPKTGPTRVRVEWWFGLTPETIEGEESVRAVRFASNGGAITIATDAVVTAVGFATDMDSPVVPAAHPDGRVERGLYAAGWLRTGPRGTIPDQRADARTLARLIAEDLRDAPARSGALPQSGEAIDFDGWRRIDLRERLGAAPGRERKKLRTRADLLAAARDRETILPQLSRDADTDTESGRRLGVGVTIVFGTESGGAELVADDLRRTLVSRADVEVRDLAGLEADDIDVSRFHLVVCSTYGDGEVPASARPFHDSLLEKRYDLSDLRYAMLGMGDRSYTKTYSRGSELIDEALAGCGAVRVGEYGRHDAGGPVDLMDAAIDWGEGIFAEIEAVASTPPMR